MQTEQTANVGALGQALVPPKQRKQMTIVEADNGFILNNNLYHDQSVSVVAKDISELEGHINSYFSKDEGQE